MQTTKVHEKKPGRVPQFQVRTDLRSGSIEACESATKSWKSSYDKWYLQALESGRLKAPTA
jgi:hypothetical protein